MRALVIDETVRQRANEIIEYAEKHVYTISDLLEINEGQMEPPGNNPEHIMIIPDGFRVVYSIELQLSGTAKHLSVSIVGDEKKMPSPVHVEAIIKLFGFENEMHDCHLSFEKLEGVYTAINVLELSVKEN